MPPTRCRRLDARQLVRVSKQQFESYKVGLASSWPGIQSAASKRTRPGVEMVAVTKKLDAGLIIPLPASNLCSAAGWDNKRINPRPQSCLCLTWSGCILNDDDDKETSRRDGICRDENIEVCYGSDEKRQD